MPWKREYLSDPGLLNQQYRIIRLILQLLYIKHLSAQPRGVIWIRATMPTSYISRALNNFIIQYSHMHREPHWCCHQHWHTLGCVAGWHAPWNCSAKRERNNREVEGSWRHREQEIFALVITTSIEKQWRGQWSKQVHEGGPVCR